MSNYIQKWEYLDYNKKTKSIEYRTDGVWVQSPYSEDLRQYTPEAILVYDYCIGDYQTDVLVRQYIAQHHPFDLSKLSKKEAKHWRFWKYLDCSKLPNLTCQATAKYNHQPYLELTSKGLRAFYYSYSNKDEKIYNTSYRIDELFFCGPKLAAILLEDRIKLRTSLWNALAPEAEFKLSDAFILFDYNKIPTKRWEYSSDNNFSGDYVELYPDRVTIGGWSNPRDGGSQDYSHEDIWYKQPNSVHKMYGSANEELAIIYENAIIKEDKSMQNEAIKSWNYELHEIRYNLSLFENNLVETYSYNNRELKNEYAPIEFFKQGRSIATARIQFELYKLITSAEMPDGLTPLEQKRWSFWQAIDHQKIALKELYTSENKQYKFSYNSYALGELNFNQQSFEEFFFKGPRQENLPLETRQSLRQLILDALDSSKHHLTLKDAYPLFDYQKIKNLQWEYTNEGGYGEGLYLREGIICLAGWSPNPKDSGGANYPIEYFWGHLEERIPSSFKEHIPEIKASLEGALVL